MRNKILLFLLGFCFFNADAQVDRVVDSLMQKKWQEGHTLRLDSIETPKAIKNLAKRKDSLIIPKSITINPLPTPEQQVPITPYNLMKMNTGEKRWFYFGQNTLTFNQASFSNWISGGNDNIGAIARLNYNLVYKKNKHYLENILQVGYGIVANEGQKTRKTEDRINLMTNYGYEIGKAYYFSSGLQFMTQFTRGYNYAQTPDPTKQDRISQFMAPGYLNLGAGISFNPNQNLQVIFRPINGLFTFVTDPHLQKKGKYGLERDGQSLRAELGARLNILYRLKIYKDIYYTNQIDFFANYLNHIERVDIYYAGSLNMKFNKYITANVTLDMVYDHDQLAKLQRKQTLGIGFIYNIGLESDKKSNDKLLKFNRK